MTETSRLRPVISLVVLVCLVAGLSAVSNRLWGGRQEAAPAPARLVITDGMTVAEFGQANGLPNPVLKEAFGLHSREELDRPLTAYGTPEQIEGRLRRTLALAAEHASKNWRKIPVKFGLWFLFLSSVFVLAKRRRMTPRLRKGLLFTAVCLFGVVLGADPNPMGTVKDAIHLYGSTGAVFPPRLIALGVFLVMVFWANKYICAWGCQAGTLQDLLFRLNRTDNAHAILGRSVKLPFVLTNTVRVAFFGAFTLFAFLWGLDIIEPVSPFGIFKPSGLGLVGWLALAVLLVASLFVYRPWCHLFCPFGLVGWLVEKKSRYRIRVDRETCIACGRCAEVCPSTVMGAILLEDKKTIPDCFACYTCREVCPTRSISFSKAAGAARAGEGAGRVQAGSAQEPARRPAGEDGRGPA